MSGAPFSFYPQDPYRNVSVYWPNGLTELTENGKIRMFKLGIYLRNRYDGFLTNNIKEVRVRSSGVHRCLESAQLSVSGAYRIENLKDEILLRLVPVHSTFFELDSVNFIAFLTNVYFYFKLFYF